MKWHFIGFILRERCNPIRHVVTVRRNRELKAIATGILVCGEDNLSDFVSLIEHKSFLVARKIENEKHLDQRQSEIVNVLGAVKNELLEQRIEHYFTCIYESSAACAKSPTRFLIHMIGVDPAEQGKGHLRGMLGKINETFIEIPEVREIEVSTYDNQKSEIYRHLGFRVTDEIDCDDIKAWRLSLSLR